MKKLVLKLDDLQVDSFAASEHAETHGKTVRAHISLNCASLSDCDSCGCGTRYAGGTCEYYTCAPTCAGDTCEYQTCMAQCTNEFC